MSLKMSSNFYWSDWWNLKIWKGTDRWVQYAESSVRIRLSEQSLPLCQVAIGNPVAKVLISLFLGQARPPRTHFLCPQAAPSVYVRGPDIPYFLHVSWYKNGWEAQVQSFGTWWGRGEEPDQRSPHIKRECRKDYILREKIKEKKMNPIE